MSDRFYHVDRQHELAVGDRIELAELDLGDVDRGGDGAEALAALYPGGLSNHGLHYLTRDLYDDDQETVWDVACELVFEQVRTELFPERPSRFQSVFGFAALRDADRFVDEFVDEPCRVLRVTAADAFTADMRLVDAEDYVHGIERAHTYWRGSTDRDRPLWEVLLVPPVEVVELVGERS